MYFLLVSSPLCHTFVITCLFFVLFVCLFVCVRDRHQRKKSSQLLASTLKISRAQGKNSMKTVIHVDHWQELN